MVRITDRPHMTSAVYCGRKAGNQTNKTYAILFARSMGYDYVYLSRLMRKPAFCICDNNGADQLPGYCVADQRLCFRYLDSTIPLLPKSKISSM